MWKGHGWHGKFAFYAGCCGHGGMAGVQANSPWEPSLFRENGEKNI